MGLHRKQKLNPREVLDCVLAVDGAGSKIDADTVDGNHAADIVQEAGREFQNQTTYQPQTNKIPMYDTNNNIKSGAPVATNDVVNKAYFEEHKNDGMPSLDGYATENYVNNALSSAGYATESYVANAIANAGHMTTEQVQTAIEAAIGQAIGGSY